ncbi:MAG: polyketide cyclase [Moraxellaceae bacterium]|nr:MAG: polyketide cyclase [Moraxellaceae bacterium]
MTATTSVESLIVKREFTAPIERVFEAWTNVEVLAQWFGPEGFTVLDAKSDLKVGGQYEWVIQSPDNNQIKHFGEYVEISKPTSLVFTWVLDDQGCSGSAGECADTLVSIAFKTVTNGTEVVLTHEKLPSEKSFEGHQFGWQSSFDSLAALLAS